MLKRAQPILPDVLATGLAVVFCGTAPGTRSAREGAYYAHPGNYFWRTLHAIGLTPSQLAPARFREMPRYGIGLTDVAKHAFGADVDLPRSAFDAAALRRRLARWQPAIIAFTSKNAARAGIGVAHPHYGEQAEHLAGCRVFVLPSPSGQARGFWDIQPWQQLAEAIRRLP